MPAIKPTTAMYAALQRYANYGGRTWKAQLIYDWAADRDGRPMQLDRIDTLDHPHCASELRKVRDIFGPTWLYSSRCKIRPHAWD